MPRLDDTPNKLQPIEERFPRGARVVLSDKGKRIFARSPGRKGVVAGWSMNRDEVSVRWSTCANRALVPPAFLALESPDAG